MIEVYRYASEAVARARAGDGPTLLECKTYRWEGHVVGEQAFLGAWRVPCRIRNRRVEAALPDPQVREVRAGGREDRARAELERIRTETAAELKEAIDVRASSPLPDPSEVTDDVFA